MHKEMEKGKLLAENIAGFIQYVYKMYGQTNDHLINRAKLYQLKLLIEEFKFQILADELFRINQFDWNEKYTYYLVNCFREGIVIIDEYVNNHYEELFLLSGRVHILKNICSSFSKQ